ncbi:hypothetical protein ACIBWG_02020 [Streptomyces griseoaurantiacus]|uniref:hypothetical protein n=1 Tax=Streptomyces griseoaurantiacus TaxID=68213 RepID=UPI00378C70C2
MKTPPMFYPQEDGKLVEIPAEHAAVLGLYRDRMPLVHEPQYTGDPLLYPLIDVDEDPDGTSEPTELEDLAFVVARTLQRKRRGGAVIPPDLERLSVLAIRAHIEDMGVFAGSCSHSEGPAAVAQGIANETANTGRKLKRVIDRAVRETAAGLIKTWWVSA